MKNRFSDHVDHAVLIFRLDRYHILAFGDSYCQRILEAFELIDDAFNKLNMLHFAKPNELFKIAYYFYLSPKELVVYEDDSKYIKCSKWSKLFTVLFFNFLLIVTKSYLFKFRITVFMYSKYGKSQSIKTIFLVFAIFSALIIDFDLPKLNLLFMISIFFDFIFLSSRIVLSLLPSLI